jgi:hypothetical protein
MRQPLERKAWSTAPDMSEISLGRQTTHQYSD